MAKLAFAFAASPSSNDHEARVLVDGMDILREIERDALGLDPVEFFAQSALSNSGQLLIGRCSCGCLGCGDIAIEVRRTADAVEWHTSYPWIARIAFNSWEYDQSVKSGAADHSWEDAGRTAERLVGELDFSHLKQHELVFVWASARYAKDQITLLFSKNGQQEMVSAPWDHRDPLAAVAAVRELLETWR